MATFKIVDRASQYRIEIIGRFAGPCVREVEASWRQALQANLARQIVVDISRLDGYDSLGRHLLAEMHKHGTVLAASTSLSLVYLNEVTSARRSTTVLQEAKPAKERKRPFVPSAKVAGSGN